MSPENNIKEEFTEFEALLPWYVAGTLDDETMRRMDRELETNAELQRLLELTLEEHDQTVRLNEDLGMPSSAALPRLMAQIEAEPKKQMMGGSLMSRISGWIEDLTNSMSPVAIGASAAAAAFILCIQAALITGLYFKQDPQGAVYETASHGPSQAKTDGLRALIAFQPELKSSDMETFLNTHELKIVDGPRPGGFYLVRFGEKVGANAAEKLIDNLRSNSETVKFAAMSE